ncbi:MAG: carboxypeptidase regulatory-like domain-containing protein, partial [Candidatus Angelobacter sp.]
MLLAFVFSAAAFGQTTASIKGTVTDPSGAAVAGAKITVKSLGVERTTQTNSAGDYEVPALPPGVYTVRADKSGFQVQMAKDVPLQVSQNSVQNFALKVASAQQVVEVQATAPVIETTTVTVGQVINQRTVQDIPLNGRHFVDLALLIPGTVTPPQNGFLTAPLRGQGSFAFNTAGNREDSVNFMINGINLNDMVQNQVTFQPTINTVSEFKVDNSTYSAEYGRNSGAIVNIATRSGTDQFHGEIYDYLRNDFFDARNAFTRKGVAPIDPFKRNQFGGDFGGPLVKDKTFFFLSYEGLRQRQGLATASGVLSNTDRNTIQAGGNAVAKGLLPFIPQANGVLSNGNPGFFGSATAPVDIDQGTADISHNLSDADRLHGYYVYQRDLRKEATAGTTITGFGDTRAGTRQVLTLNETHVFSSALVNEARLGANRVLISFNPNNLADPASVGINLGPGAPLGLPVISITDIGLTFGSERNFPQGRGDTTFVLADTLSYIHGPHSFKFGGEWRDFRNNNFNSDPGALTFSTTANFISGTVNTAARTVAATGSIANRLDEGALDFFAQDSYKFRPYLTLELGLRYAWNMTPTDARNRFVNFDPATVSLIPVSQPYAQNNKNFQPRLGFAWDLFHNTKTVLRAAYAYQVDQPISGIASGLSGNPPFALPISVSNQPVAALSAAFNGTPAN